jgi:hypothetical protein
MEFVFWGAKVAQTIFSIQSREKYKVIVFHHVMSEWGLFRRIFSS